MKGAHDNRRYEAGDAIKLEIVLQHKANLKEVRAIFEQETHNRSAPPLIARGQPRPISNRSGDGEMRSRLEAEITLPRAVTPGTYELTRISYETAGGHLGHLEEGEGLPLVSQMTFEVIGEPADTPGLVDIAFADSRGGRTRTS